ncbi:MAG: glycerophosphodiester phosphodiesterase family protein [Alphaproteobacteria bacterium]|uniref:glycerophosphodiester phosphodiesterase family protein n=1 Tax=Brevundimonas sp. TaxID=1871086 RepID=UPI000DB61104|nr:glycerophosphodiester phosphodiesterase family protein [Brevundimonas sp.]MBU1271598.1 glycerophosphodiester phosphodiesterase family protein [Alphaproteobacteria bacterium]MBJ7318759.1 glycerophosphodiester phosphodiesterase family protein [Brevundimonas sp.]MBU1520298.1 glycerophosphodiester phosphodiesterase family protein [Alphaproteobacteria bacterium]MBU2030833.1 glycerophosphodiester phosphodiesterase family protein [Alphaproteobacteria bacterium]MBU2163525.1 glycerophosphodiester ph
MILRKLLSASVIALAISAAPVAASAQTGGLPEAVSPVVSPFPTTIDLMRCLVGQGVVLTSGHRAGPEPGYPENAIETAAHTLAQAPVLIEMDARTTRDGVLVFMHDDTLERTTTGAGAVGAHSLAELQALRLKDDEGTVTDFSIPTLTQTLEFMRGRGILAIDVKEDASIPAIAEAVRAADARNYTLINLYRPSQARAFHRIDPQLSLIHPVNSLADLEVLQLVGVNLRALTAWTGIDRIDPRDQSLWAALRREGVPVMFATLFVADRDVAAGGGGEIFNGLADDGVDVIPTDHHLEAFAILDGRRNTGAGLAACGALGKSRH